MFIVWNPIWSLMYNKGLINQNCRLNYFKSFLICSIFQNFAVLFVGRLLAGMATSILFSAFESWLINEHRRVCK